jgi:predicted DNA-binding protein
MKKTIKFRDWVKETKIKLSNELYQRHDKITQHILNQIFKNKL